MPTTQAPTKPKVNHTLLIQDVSVGENHAALMPFPEEGLMKVKDVLMYIRVGRSTWLGWVKDGIAPQPRVIGFNTFWDAQAVRQFIKGEVQS